MPDPLELVGETNETLRLGDEPAMPVGAADQALASFERALPDAGDGAIAALTELIEQGTLAATRSAGPRFFHFVTGGTTPAALGADWLASTLDQNAFAWASSPLGSRLEAVALGQEAKHVLPGAVRQMR